MGWSMKVLHPTISWPPEKPDRIPKSLKLRWCGDQGYSGSRVDRLWKETLHKVQGAAKAQETRGMIGGRCILKKEIAWVRQCMHMVYFIFVFWHHILHKSGCFLGSVVTHHHMTLPRRPAQQIHNFMRVIRAKEKNQKEKHFGVTSHNGSHLDLGSCRIL